MNNRESPTPVSIERLSSSAYSVPTETKESDGTLEWDKTTLVVVHLAAAGIEGIGYSYADAATAAFIDAHLASCVEGWNAMDIPAAWKRMVQAVRNMGRPGVASMAISAVDNALWDLKAKLLSQSLSILLGRAKESVPAYGSGGFTSYSISQLQEQLSGWAKDGMRAVKMKVGREPDKDEERVKEARRAIGDGVALYVDANGAYYRKQAAAFSALFYDSGVQWFEEPVTSDDLDGLGWIRGETPGGMEVAAGEYGYEPTYFARMIAAGAIDVLQADATRCGGITGFLAVAKLCEAAHIPLSAHCAPSLHCHLGCALDPVRNVEYFHDHQRIEHLLFDGSLRPVNGALFPDLSRPGIGLALRAKEAAPYAVYGRR